jgi:hypothetical protein
MMRRQGNIPAWYDFISFDAPAYHWLMEFEYRIHGSSYRYHVYVILQLDPIKFQMT